MKLKKNLEDLPMNWIKCEQKQKIRRRGRIK
jgi:hypothetical protein